MSRGERMVRGAHAQPSGSTIANLRKVEACGRIPGTICAGGLSRQSKGSDGQTSEATSLGRYLRHEDSAPKGKRQCNPGIHSL